MKNVMVVFMVFGLVACCKSGKGGESESKRTDNAAVVVGIDTATGAATINGKALPQDEVKQTIGDNFTYGQKVKFTNGFYKGCIGKIVARHQMRVNVRFDVDLNKKCDNQEIMFFSTDEHNLLVPVK